MKKRPKGEACGPFAFQMRKGELLTPACPSRKILNHVTSRWGSLALVALMSKGRLRFGQLRRAIGGVSEKMLAQTLKELENDGFVARKALEVVPPHVEYSLTPMGRQVGKHVSALGGWIENNLPGIMESRLAKGAAVTEKKALRNG